MKVLFLDFDGVIYTIHNNTESNIEKRVKILSEICHRYNLNVVISASAKELINEFDLTTETKSINELFNLFTKYNINLVGVTPQIGKHIKYGIYIPIWKEYEIESYLNLHPEIEAFVILDDDDLGEEKSDLKMYKDYLVKPIYYSINNPEEEGLLPKHIDEVGNILDKQIKKERNM